MAFEKIGSVLPTLKNRVSMGTTMEAAYIVQMSNMILPNVLPEELWDHVRVVFFRDKTLTINCSSSMVAQGVRYRENLLRKEIAMQTNVEIKKIVYVNKSL
ncbi:MAG: hypothetical protein KatS3mg087_0208 [Patescibacteria group bacterium]|nr:MAG: hypothetical protein KatS3mg087_0208 [Patescibacteria group bacterium]